MYFFFLTTLVRGKGYYILQIIFSLFFPLFSGQILQHLTRHTRIKHIVMLNVDFEIIAIYKSITINLRRVSGYHMKCDVVTT